jgi:hypothetical protein
MHRWPRKMPLCVGGRWCSNGGGWEVGRTALLIGRRVLSLPSGFLGIIARDRPRAHLVISPSLLNTPIRPSIDVQVVNRAAVPLELKSRLLSARSHQ